MTFNDRDTAAKIMKEHKPAEMKRQGKNVSGYVHTVWRSRKVDVMRRGLETKFKNNNLKHFLLSTGITLEYGQRTTG